MDSSLFVGITSKIPVCGNFFPFPVALFKTKIPAWTKKEVNIHVKTIEAQRGWSGNKVRKVTRSVATSIVGSNTLNRKNFSNENILKIKTTEAHFHKSQSGFLCADFPVKSYGDTNQTDGTTAHCRVVLLTEFPAHNIYFAKTWGFPRLSAADMVMHKYWWTLQYSDRVSLSLLPSHFLTCPAILSLLPNVCFIVQNAFNLKFAQNTMHMMFNMSAKPFGILNDYPWSLEDEFRLK